MRSKNINTILSTMREQGKLKNMQGKGDAGEDAALQIILERQRHTTGLVYQSFKYPYQKNRSGVTYLGNIKYEDGEYVDYTEARNGRALFDEIDILYVTPYRIIPIEVKAYHANIVVYDNWMDKQGTPVDKSPITQAEKHARHLYHAIAPVLPDGRPEYIRPIVCFVDRCKLNDKRASDHINYLPCCILNTLKSCVMKVNTPLKYNIDINTVKDHLKEIRVNVRREYI